MWKILLFTLYLILATKEEAYKSNSAVTVAIKESEINLIKKELMPLIWSKIGELHIDDQTTKIIGIKVDINSISGGVTFIPEQNIQIALVENTNCMKVTINDLSAHMKAHLWMKWWFITHGSEATGSLHGMSLSFIIKIEELNDRPQIVVQNFDLVAHSSNLDIHLTGNILDKLLNPLISFLKTLFFGKLTKYVEDVIPPAVDQTINTILDTLPLNYSFSDQIAVKYSVPHIPAHIQDQFLVIMLNGYMYAKADPRPPAPLTKKFSTYYQWGKGVQVGITQYLLETGVSTAYRTNLTQITTEFDILGYNVHITCNATQLPSLIFSRIIYAHLKVIIYIYIYIIYRQNVMQRLGHQQK